MGTSLLSSFLGGGASIPGLGGGSATSGADSSAGITNNANFQVGGSGSQSQSAPQTATTSPSTTKPGTSDGSYGIGGAIAQSDPTTLYVAIGAVVLIAAFAILKK